MLDLLFTNTAYASVDSFIHNVNKLILNPLIVLLFALAFAYFSYGILMFLVNQDNEEKRSEGKTHMIWGLIGLTIMFGVWAILSMVLNTLGIKNVNPKQGTVQFNDYTPNTTNQFGG